MCIFRITFCYRNLFLCMKKLVPLPTKKDNHMKRIIFLSFCLVLSLFSFAQNQAQICKLGFTSEMSNRYYWGLSKPVVTSVSANSPAAKAGLKVNDIIERIAGQETAGLSADQVFAMLQEDKFIKLTISNLKYRNKEITFSKDCKLAGAINEEDLATSFSFYSLEDSQERGFTCPFKTTVKQCPEVNYMNYKTFSLAPDTWGPIEGKAHDSLNEQLIKGLEGMGLTYKKENPDLYISASYIFRNNYEYEPNGSRDKLPYEWRYNLHTGKFDLLPIYYNPLIHVRNIQSYVTVNVRFFDRKYSTEKEPFIVWECSATDALAEPYPINEYATINIPLMLMQYPFPQTFETARFRYLRQKFNYTGINYDAENFKKVFHVDPVSPSAQAGIQAGDVIQKINDLKTEGDARKLSSSYRAFIDKTMPFRDEKTRYTDINGYSRCMYWNVFDYPKVEQEIRGSKSKAVFSYLFNFEPYVNMLSVNFVLFEIKRGKETLNIQVDPIITEIEYFQNY